MEVKLSIIVPSLTGEVPRSLKELELKARASGGVEQSGLSSATQDEVEVVVVKGVSPVAAARQQGLERAKGEYVAWVDADDEVEEGWLEAILGAIDLKDRSSGAGGVDILSFNVRQEWHDGSGRESQVLDGRKCGQLWSKVFRRSLFYGLKFEGAVHEDFRIQCQMPRKVKRVHIDKVLYVYKRRATGLSQHRDAKATMRALWGLIKICNSWEMAKGIWERIWDFAKTPIRRAVGR